MVSAIRNAAPFSLQSSAMPSPSASQKEWLQSFDLSLGEPRRQVFPGDLVKSVLNYEAINYYYPAYGLNDLRSAIQERFYPNLSAHAYTVLMTHGAINAIDLLMRSHLKAGDEILIPNPCFPPYHQLAAFVGAKVKSYLMPRTTDGFEFDIEGLRGSVGDQTKLLFINSPHNPTGAMLSWTQRQSLRRLLEDFPQLLVISDEVYSDIIFEPGSHLSLAGLSPRVLVVNSFSKTFSMQGFRIGWILAPEAQIPLLSPYLQNSIGCVSSLGQEIVKELLLSSFWKPCSYIQARDIACRILRESGIEYAVPKGAFFLLIAVQDDLAASRALAQEGIKVVPGSAFGSQTSGWIRVCFAQTDDQVERAFTQLVRVFQDLQLGPL